MLELVVGAGCWSWLLELVVGAGCWSWLLELVVVAGFCGNVWRLCQWWF